MPVPSSSCTEYQNYCKIYLRGVLPYKYYFSKMKFVQENGKVFANVIFVLIEKFYIYGRKTCKKYLEMSFLLIYRFSIVKFVVESGKAVASAIFVLTEILNL